MSEIPEWARKRAILLGVEESERNPNSPWATSAFARYIAEHEEPPVDPLLIEAREIAARTSEAYERDTFHADMLRDGTSDDSVVMAIALAALKRGMELEREKSS